MTNAAPRRTKQFPHPTKMQVKIIYQHYQTTIQIPAHIDLVFSLALLPMHQKLSSKPRPTFPAAKPFFEIIGLVPLKLPTYEQNDIERRL